MFRTFNAHFNFLLIGKLMATCCHGVIYDLIVFVTVGLTVYQSSFIICKFRILLYIHFKPSVAFALQNSAIITVCRLSFVCNASAL